jgi:predicted TPR repeat methyltransferase
MSEISWPKEVVDQVSLANELFIKGDIVEASRSIKEALDYLPDDESLISTYGNLLLKLNDLDGAYHQFKKLTVLFPYNQSGLVSLAVTYLLMNKWEEARILTEDLYSSFPNDQEIIELMMQLKIAYDQNNRPGQPLYKFGLANGYEYISCPYCGFDKSTEFSRRADIVKCDNCETIYLRTRKSQREMEKLYQSYADDASHMALPITDHQIKSSILRRDYFLEEILKYNPNKGILLDIGCGWGAFLDNSRDKGFQPRGIELTRKCVNFANDRLGLNVTNDQFLTTEFENESISVVTMLHVLEHLPYPLEAISKVYEILIPGGLYCGIVPNINSFCARTEKESWYWLDPDYHYVHYSPNVLKSHLTSAGFEILSIYTKTGDYGPENVINVIRNALGNISKDLAQKILDEIEQIGSGEEIRFFAYKPKMGMREISK